MTIKIFGMFTTHGWQISRFVFFSISVDLNFEDSSSWMLIQCDRSMHDRLSFQTDIDEAKDLNDDKWLCWNRNFFSLRPRRSSSLKKWRKKKTVSFQEEFSNVFIVRLHRPRQNQCEHRAFSVIFSFFLSLFPVSTGRPSRRLRLSVLCASLMLPCGIVNELSAVSFDTWSPADFYYLIIINPVSWFELKPLVIRFWWISTHHGGTLMWTESWMKWSSLVHCTEWVDWDPFPSNHPWHFAWTSQPVIAEKQYEFVLDKSEQARMRTKIEGDPLTMVL